MVHWLCHSEMSEVVFNCLPHTQMWVRNITGQNCMPVGYVESMYSVSGHSTHNFTEFQVQDFSKLHETFGDNKPKQKISPNPTQKTSIVQDM